MLLRWQFNEVKAAGPPEQDNNTPIKPERGTLKERVRSRDGGKVWA